MTSRRPQSRCESLSCEVEFTACAESDVGSPATAAQVTASEKHAAQVGSVNH